MNFLYRNSFFCLFLVIFQPNLWAQPEIKWGIRAGINLSKTLMPSETDDAGNKLESNNLSARVVAGVTMRAAFTDRLGLLSELNFSQKGSYYRYEGSSYMQFDAPINQTFTGHKRILAINNINGYIEIPVNFYYEVVDDKFSLELGAAAGFLVSSRGLGVLKYIDEDRPDELLEYNLDYRYYTDTAGHIKSTDTRTGRIDGISIDHPRSVGAYYFNSEKKGSYFNTFDLSANIGAAYYLTEGLRVGARVQYSLLDITNNNYDVSLYKLDNNNQPIPRKDIDRNFGVQLYLGLQF